MLGDCEEVTIRNIRISLAEVEVLLIVKVSENGIRPDSRPSELNNALGKLASLQHFPLLHA